MCQIAKAESLRCKLDTPARVRNHRDQTIITRQLTASDEDIAPQVRFVRERQIGRLYVVSSNAFPYQAKRLQ